MSGIVTHPDPLICECMRTGQVRMCECGALIDKDGGCNNVKCTICGTEWCWACGFIKYLVCNDASHNSH